MNPFSQPPICSTCPRRLLYPCLKYVVNIITNYLMSALCPNLPELKKWKEHFPNSFLDWRSSFTKIYQITKDNKLRQFLFKILHRIIITKKELKKFNIASDDHCNLCSRTDSIMHTFLECDVSLSLFQVP